MEQNSGIWNYLSDRDLEQLIGNGAHLVNDFKKENYELKQEITKLKIENQELKQLLNKNT